MWYYCQEKKYVKIVIIRTVDVDVDKMKVTTP